MEKKMETKEVGYLYLGRCHLCREISNMFTRLNFDDAGWQWVCSDCADEMFDLAVEGGN